MDPLSGAASVIAVIQLTCGIVEICGTYISKVDGARQDIIRLQQSAGALLEVLKSLDDLLHNQNSRVLTTTNKLSDHITACRGSLAELKEKIDPKTRHQRSKKWLFRALKWPLKRTEVTNIVDDLEGYKTLFSLALEIDQTRLSNAINQKIDLRGLQIAKGAAFDSYENNHDECLPGTRVELLQTIEEWTKLPHGKCIFWLNGMAGTGKSTIARTISSSLKRQKLLGGSFFFKRGEEDRGNAKRLFPTLIGQLITDIPQLVLGIQKAIEDDPNISEKMLGDQFRNLVFRPLLDLQQGHEGTVTREIVFVIDALDECDNDRDIKIILQLLPQVRKLTSTRMRFLLTSRPELPIRLGFKNIVDSHQDLVLHDIPRQVIEHDISLYFENHFFRLRQERELPPGWPGEEPIKILTERAAPLFISAATLYRFISDINWNPRKRLREILADQSIYVSKLDSTYMPLLNQLILRQDKSEVKRLVQEFKDIIGSVILVFTPLPAKALSLLIQIEEDDIRNRLDRFQSVIRIPEDLVTPIRLLHLSFRDFLLNTEKKDNSEFWIDEKQTHEKLASQCLRLMKQGLRRNICDLPNDSTLRSELKVDFAHKCLPLELRYSCRYWAQHLTRCHGPANQIFKAVSFLKVHFLHWIEAMSLLGILCEVFTTIHSLQSMIQNDENTETVQLLYEMKRFILKNRHIADFAPLQLYSSCLIFAPETAMVRGLFNKEIPTWISRLPSLERFWGPELQTLEGHTGAVAAVAFSPDNKLLATCSRDRKIKLWNSMTGALQLTLEGHLDSVPTVVISSDGQLLVSGSHDRTVRIWDAATGNLLYNLHGHSNMVWSVDFSPDNKCVASSSVDCTVKLWEVATGALIKTLEGHTDPIQAVSFSPDGQVLASASHDMTIKLWDTTSGSLQNTLKGHSNWVRTIAFSSDGQLLASGSHDSTIKLWDPQTGALKRTLTVTGALQKTLDGHQSSVWTVSFFPDSRLLASGSHDATIRIWDTTTGTLRQILESHMFAVSAVKISLDSRLLASGSYDSTAKLWDVGTALQSNILDNEDANQSMIGHSGTVGVLAFSPNGQLLASGAIDGKVKLWSVPAGDLVQTLEGHSSFIFALSFSPDGYLLASGSQDTTIILWDTSTGNLQYTLKEHLDPIGELSFSPDSQLLASASSDQTVKIWNTTTGALKEDLSVEKLVTHIEFLNDGVLETNLGPLDIQSSYNSSTVVETSSKDDILLEENWIVIKGIKALWLPTECRPSCSAVQGHIVALGHTSGSVFLMEFCTE